METPPVVLTIAGFDPSSGAGVTADIKTIAAHGCDGVACITALTVQSSSGVRRVEPVEEDLVRETLEELAGDLELGAVHIGMLGTGKVVRHHAFARHILTSKSRARKRKLGKSVVADDTNQAELRRMIPY